MVVNQSGTTPNPSHFNTVQHNSHKISPQTVTKKRKPRRLWPILLVLAVAGVGLEFFGVANIIRSFGEGDRPLISVGIWHLTDVPENVWASPSINGLVAKRVISGYPNDSFYSEAAVTRAEFATMLQAAFGQGFSQQPTDFNAVTPVSWAASAIEYSTTAGFFEGFPSQIFQPNQPLSNASSIRRVQSAMINLQ